MIYRLCLLRKGWLRSGTRCTVLPRRGGGDLLVVIGT